MSGSPLVSVIIPTYNRGDVLERAIDSAVNQKYENIEVIVIDDGSVDNTESVVSNFPDVTYIKHEKNLGGSHARNTGIKNSSGDILAFLDSDDEWMPNKISTQVRHLLESDSIACYSNVKRDSQHLRNYIDKMFPPANHPESRTELIRMLLSHEIFIHAGSTLVAQSGVVDEIGGFDEDFERYQDVEFTIRLAKKGRVSYIDEDLAILYDSGSPSPEKVIRAQKMLQSKFSDEIQEFESKGYNITGSHEVYIARQQILRSEYRSAVSHLRNSRFVNNRQLLGLFKDIFKSFINS